MRGEKAVVQCPFYRNHTRWTINCEGVLPETSVSTCFENESRRRLHMDICCNEIDGGNCSIYRAIMRKYK